MRKAIFWIVGIVVLGALAYSVFRAPHQASSPPPAAAPAELRPQTAMPVMRAFSLELPWAGQVQSWTRIQVVTLTDGRVESIAVADGAPVKTGETLFTIGGARVAARRQQLQDQVSALVERVDLARQVVESQNQSMKERLATLNEVAAARDTLKKLTADLEVARQQLQMLQDAQVVKAPAAGAFTGRRVSAGQAVSAGQTLAEIIDASHLRIEADLYPPPGVSLEGLDATVRLSQTQSLRGKVTQVLPAGDAEGATVVWIEGPEIDSALRANQAAGGILAAQTHEAWGVPQSAVVYDEREAPFVFVARAGKSEKTAVQVGVASQGWVEVLSGLDGTLPVVTEGAYELFYREFSKTYTVPD
jgi:RND family efflux transporter MFP subunit